MDMLPGPDSPPNTPDGPAAPRRQAASVPELDLADWRLRVWRLYEPVRALAPGADVSTQSAALHAFRSGRDALFRDHPQTPLPPTGRAAFSGLEYFPFDPALRLTGEFEPDPSDQVRELPASHAGGLRFRPIGRVLLPLPSGPARLTVFWLTDYAGGIFLPFRDATSGSETYGGGRYLWDSAKGADLGMHGERLVLDFNYAYNPSCAYDPRWACPLAPPDNRLDVGIRAGELAYAGSPGAPRPAEVSPSVAEASRRPGATPA